MRSHTTTLLDDIEMTVHALWTTKDWANAKEEEVIQALLNPPELPDPSHYTQIYRHHPTAKVKYLNLYYQGNIPESIKRLHKIQ